MLKYELQLTLQYISFLLARKHIQHISSHSYIIWVPYTLIQDQVSKYLGISLPCLEIMFSNNLFLVQSSKYYIMKRRVSILNYIGQVMHDSHFKLMHYICEHAALVVKPYHVKIGPP